MDERADHRTRSGRVGLANKAVPEERLLDEAKALAKTIAAKSPLSVRATIELLNDAKEKSFAEAVREEAEWFGRVFVSEDAKEGVQAFLENGRLSLKGNDPCKYLNVGT